MQKRSNKRFTTTRKITIHFFHNLQVEEQTTSKHNIIWLNLKFSGFFYLPGWKNEQ